MEYGFLRRFRRRRLLAFLRREHLYATLDALGGETRLFLNARTLQAMVAHCRWEEARRYVRRFLPRRRIGVEARTILRFITYLSAVDDVAQGRRPGNEFAGDHLEREFEADSSSNTMYCADFVRKISHKRSSFPGRWESVEWQFLRIKAALTVKELVMNTPEFSHLLRLPRYPVNPQCTMPVWFGCRRKRQRKIIGRMPASLLARCFLPKERSPSPKKQGIPGAPVVPCIGRNCGLSSANSVTEHLNQEDCHSESVASTEHSPTTGELCPDVVGASSGDMDHMHKKVNALQKISDDMIKLLTNTCTFGPDHNALVGKMLEQEAVLHEMRLDCLKAIIRGGTSTS